MHAVHPIYLFHLWNVLCSDNFSYGEDVYIEYTVVKLITTC